jgi:GDSL-like Lipase/Acylhydrolase family
MHRWGGARRLRVAFVATFVALGAVVLAGCFPAPPPPGSGVPTYVALGDSYTAGPLIPLQENTPLGCLRSTNNYPHLAAPKLRLPLRDVSCSGAETGDMTQSQNVSPGPNPPQFNALDADTKIVTIGIGGNDMGFLEIAIACSSLDPTATPCQDKYVVNGVDTIKERIDAVGPKVAAVLEGIHARSPKAKVFLVGYPSVVPVSGNGCWPTLPITAADLPYVRTIITNLNAMLEQRAAANNTTYVDTFNPSIGKDACALPTVRWVEPVVPVLPAAPVHPNQIGMQGVASVLLQTING